MQFATPKKLMHCFRRLLTWLGSEATDRCEKCSTKRSKLWDFCCTGFVCNGFCTIYCTELTHSCPNTRILSSQHNPILLKMHDTQNLIRAVAPRVAGSNPVAHPNFSDTYIGFASSAVARALHNVSSKFIA